MAKKRKQTKAEKDLRKKQLASYSRTYRLKKKYKEAKTKTAEKILHRKIVAERTLQKSLRREKKQKEIKKEIPVKGFLPKDFNAWEKDEAIQFLTKGTNTNIVEIISEVTEMFFKMGSRDTLVIVINTENDFIEDYFIIEG